MLGILIALGGSAMTTAERIFAACFVIAMAVLTLAGVYNDQFYHLMRRWQPEWRRWPRDVEKLFAVALALLMFSMAALLIGSIFFQ